MVLFQPFPFVALQQLHSFRYKALLHDNCPPSFGLPQIQRLCLVLLALSNETRVALLIRATSTETGTDESRPCAALEEKDREDDAEGEAEGGADEEGGEAAVPLVIVSWCSCLRLCVIVVKR